MTPAFTDPAARRRWDEYFTEVDRRLRPAGADASGLRDDLARHVVDSMAAMPGGSEGERLEAALVRLGQPLDYLHPLLADASPRRGRPAHGLLTIAWGLARAVVAGSWRAAMALARGVGYLLLASLLAIALAKPLWQGHVGLFRQPDGSLGAGIMAHTTGAHELLGWWSIPLALLLASLLHGVLTKGWRGTGSRR